MNIFIMAGTWQTFRRVSRGGHYDEEDMEMVIARGGPLAHLFRPVFKLIRKSWHMYPLGFLFGLGFDTATEVALLAISATEASKGLPFWSVLIFPACSRRHGAVDTTDGILMLGAYGWAFLNPLRKLFYNLTVTAVSVLVALLVGGIEASGLLAKNSASLGDFGISSAPSTITSATSVFVIIGIFFLCWMVSVLVYRSRGYD